MSGERLGGTMSTVRGLISLMRTGEENTLQKLVSLFFQCGDLDDRTVNIDQTARVGRCLLSPSLFSRFLSLLI